MNELKEVILYSNYPMYVKYLDFEDGDTYLEIIYEFEERDYDSEIKITQNIPLSGKAHGTIDLDYEYHTYLNF